MGLSAKSPDDSDEESCDMAPPDCIRSDMASIPLLTGPFARGKSATSQCGGGNSGEGRFHKGVDRLSGYGGV